MCWRTKIGSRSDVLAVTVLVCLAGNQNQQQINATELVHVCVFLMGKEAGCLLVEL